MKARIVACLCVFGMTVSAFGALSNVLATARAQRDQRDYAGAKATITAGLAEYPSAASNDLSLAYTLRGMVNSRLLDSAEAVRDFDTAYPLDASQKDNVIYLKANTLINIPPKQVKAGRDLLLAKLTEPDGMAQHMIIRYWWLIGKSYANEGKLSQAVQAVGNVTNYPVTYTSSVEHKTQYANNHLLLGDVLRKDGKEAKASEAYLAYVITMLPIIGASNESSMVWAAFNKVNLSAVGAVEYKAFLKEAIKSTRNKPDTNKFLALLSSELDKMNKQQ